MGVTAASADTPDTFEIFKFVTRTPVNPGQAAQRPPFQAQFTPPQAAGGGAGDASSSSGADADATRRTADQLDEILRRLQAQGQALDDLLAQDLVQRSNAMQDRVQELRAQVATSEQLQALGRRLTQLESTLGVLGKDIREKDYSSHFSELTNSLNSRHEAILEYLPEKMHTGASCSGLVDSERC